jgi:hypothetical protein
MTSWARSWAWSFINSRLTWVLAVAALMFNRAAMSALDSPRPTSTRTSSSRSVRSLSSTGAGERGAVRALHELGDEPAGHAGRQERVAGGQGPDAGQQLFGAGVFEQEAAGPGPQRAVHVLVEIERGENEHFGRRTLRRGNDLAGRFDPVGHRHTDIHQDHIWVMAGHQVDGFGTVGRFADHSHVVGCVDQHPEAAPHQSLVIGDHDADHESAALIGRQART